MQRAPAIRPILVVDDDEDSIALIEALLKRAKVSNPVVAARSAEEAKTVLLKSCPAAGGRRAEKPIMVVVDINMPGKSGFDVLKWIKRRKSFHRLAVVMWSHSTDPNDQRRAAQLKADAFLFKFPNSQALAAIVRAAAESCLRPARKVPV